MTLIDRILRLRYRQTSNDCLKSVLHLKSDRFCDLFSEIKRMTRPAFSSPQVVWNFWLEEIMPMFVDGDDLKVLGYKVKIGKMENK